MYKKQNKFQAFTLVELIVVITILAVLATVAFISFQGYSASSRDAVRMTNLASIDKGLSLLKFKNEPFPDPAGPTTEIEVNGVAISTQGFIDKKIANKIGVFGELEDSVTGYLPIYVLSADKQRYQIGMFQELSPEVSFLNSVQVLAKQNPYFITAGDKLGVILSEDGIPVNATDTPKVDILNTTDTYLAYIDETTKVEGSGESLYQVNPNYDCARIFEDSTKSSGTYMINPKGTEIQVYCHRKYPTRTFYDYLVDGDFEDPTGTVWDNSKKKSEAAYEGSYGMEYIKSKNVPSNNLTYVNPEKSYKISGMFKSVGEHKSRLYYGFVEYDKDFKVIQNEHVNIVIGTETVLTEDVNPGDKTITFENIGGTMCDKWESNGQFLTHAKVAFDIDDSGEYNDLPNRNVSLGNGSYTDAEKYQGKNMRSMSNNGDTCTVTFGGTMVHTYEAGTKIRMHNDGAGYNYRAASNASVPDTWKKYSGTVQGISNYGVSTSTFRKGTVFIKPLILANYPYSSYSSNYYKNNGMTLQFDNLKLEAY